MMMPGLRLCALILFLLALNAQPSLAIPSMIQNETPIGDITIANNNSHNIANLTFVSPATCYLALATAEGRSSGNQQNVLQFNFSVDGVQVSRNMLDPDNTDGYYPFYHANVTCLSAGSHTFDLVVSKNGTWGPGTTAIIVRNGRIVLLDVGTANGATGGNWLMNGTQAQSQFTTQTANISLANVTFNVPAGGGTYLILARTGWGNVTAATQVGFSTVLANTVFGLQNSTLDLLATAGNIRHLRTENYMADFVTYLAAGSYTATLFVNKSDTQPLRVNQTRLIVVNLTGAGYAVLNNFSTTINQQGSTANTWNSTINYTFAPSAQRNYTVIGSMTASVLTDTTMNANTTLSVDSDRYGQISIEPPAVGSNYSHVMLRNVTLAGGAAHSISYYFTPNEASLATAGSIPTLTLIYPEQVCGETIERDLNLTMDIIETTTGGGRACLTIGARGITIDCRGHAIKGPGYTAPGAGSYGILNNGYDNVTIKHCTIFNFTNGVYFNTSADNATFWNNTVWNISVTREGVGIPRLDSGYGIYVNASENATVFNNTVANTSNGGIGIAGAGPLEAPKAPIHKLINNTLRDNGLTGIALANASGFVLVDNNTIWHSTGIGLLIQNTNQTLVMNTTIFNVSQGIRVANSSWVNITNVTIEARNWGIWIINSTNVSISNSSINVSAVPIPIGQGSVNSILRLDNHSMNISANNISFGGANSWLGADSFGLYRNVTFGGDSPEATDGQYWSTLRVRYYARIEVTDLSGAAIDGAFYNITNVTFVSPGDADAAFGSGDTGRRNLTTTTGLGNWTLLELGYFNETHWPELASNQSNYTFNASKSGYATNWTNATINFTQTVTVTLKTAAATSLAFSVKIPGNETGASYPSENASAGLATIAIVFNWTNATGLMINASTWPGYQNVNQSGHVPIFNYTNDGNTAINISLFFAAGGWAAPHVAGSNITVEAGLRQPTWKGPPEFCEVSGASGGDDRPLNPSTTTAGHCKNISTAPRFIISALGVGASQGVWLWADFNFTEYNFTEGRNLTQVSGI